MRGVRQACTRVARAGYDVQVRRVRDVPPTSWRRCSSAADAWRGDAVERGFSMALSRLGDPADGDCVGRGRDGRTACCAALLHFVPWGTDGLSLDLMRRDRNADNGLNEFMIAQARSTACPELGVRRVSLNFAVFRDAIERGERIGAGPILRVWRALLIFAVALVADRVAVPVQREVPARTGSRGSSPSRRPATCRASRSPRSRPRRSSCVRTG